MITLDGLRVLVVDDEPFMRRTIRSVLRAVGRFDVREADDGDTALVETARLKPDVVLCDISMPRVGGLRFVEQLRQHPDPALRETPVVILTGHAEITVVVAASKLRINSYLIKPISPKQLGEKLRGIFDGAEPPGVAG